MGDITNADSYISKVSEFKQLSKNSVLGYYSDREADGIDYRGLVGRAINKYGLTPDEAHSVFGYTTNLFYRDLNRVLSTGGDSSASGLAALINDGLRKLPDAGLVQHRGLRFDNEADIAKFDSEFKLRGRVESNSFWSSAPQLLDDYKGVRNLEIQTRSAKDISELSFGVNFHEKIGRESYSTENIIPTGVKFEVVGRNKNGSVIIKEK
ncbi:hypothetical protein A3759_18030 [Thalassolituus sp. HI0120]|nr:hypothetical protein A3759_18030 [Thalassolituus sp. HI0120]